jgi:hypothetical protein
LNRLALATGLALAVVALGAQPRAFDGAARAAALTQATPLPLESAIIEIQEGPGQGSPTPTPTPTPTPAPRRRGGRPTPTPSPTATPTPSPEPTPSPSPTPLPTPPAPSTPVPTAPPAQRATPQPVAPNQPTVSQSLEDSGVKNILRRPIAQLSAFAWLTGTWHARNIEILGDGRQRDLGTNTYVFAQTMKGRWIFGADGKATDYFYITFDPFVQRWILVRMNPSPAYGIWTSDRGWQRNTIEFTSTYAYSTGRPYRRRITIDHKDPRSFNIYDEEQLPDGSWTSDDAVQLTKQ